MLPVSSRRHSVDKEMGLTHAEFFRIIDRALDGRPYLATPRGVTIKEDSRSLEITLSDETERRIALMVLPVTRVRLTFTGYDPDTTAETLAWFDRWFQRGGG